MNIKTISATGFNGRNFHYPLQPITVFHGENGVGKTAILTALRLGLLGYDPRLPKKKADVFAALASGKTMNVTVVFSNGKQNVVNYMLRGQSVTGTPEINVEVPNIMLDLDEFFALSKKDRVKWLLGKCVSLDDRETLAKLDDSIAKAEREVKDGEFSKKNLEQALQARAQAAAETITRPPEDYAGRIPILAAGVATLQQRVNALYKELADRDAAVNRYNGTVKSRDEAVDAAETPVCEHCGQTVLALRGKAATSFNAALAAAAAHVDTFRSREDIIADGKATKAEIAIQEAELNNMRTLQSRWDQHVGQEKEASTQREKLVAVSSKLETDQARLKSLVAERKELLQRSVGPLIQRAHYFTKPIARIEIQWIDDEIGYFPPGSEKLVPMEVFSGRELAATIAGLGWAFSENTPLKLVVMDEMGILSKTTKARVIGTVKELIKQGLVDQFIGIDVSGHDYDLEKGGLIHVE